MTTKKANLEEETRTKEEESRVPVSERRWSAPPSMDDQGGIETHPATAEGPRLRQRRMRQTMACTGCEMGNERGQTRSSPNVDKVTKRGARRPKQKSREMFYPPRPRPREAKTHRRTAEVRSVDASRNEGEHEQSEVKIRPLTRWKNPAAKSILETSVEI
jgi:hypothetical protein